MTLGSSHHLSEPRSQVKQGAHDTHQAGRLRGVSVFMGLKGHPRSQLCTWTLKLTITPEVVRMRKDSENGTHPVLSHTKTQRHRERSRLSKATQHLGCWQLHLPLAKDWPASGRVLWLPPAFSPSLTILAISVVPGCDQGPGILLFRGCLSAHLWFHPDW